MGSLLDKLTLLTLDNSLSAFLLLLHNDSYICILAYITLITVQLKANCVGSTLWVSKDICDGRCASTIIRRLCQPACIPKQMTLLTLCGNG